MNQDEIDRLLDAFVAEVVYRTHPFDTPLPRHKEICEKVLAYIRHLHCKINFYEHQMRE